MSRDGQLKLPADKVNVLIADDMQQIREILASMLQHMGFVNITEAANGKSALKAIHSCKFDLILCDWDMPQAKGDDLLKFARQTEHNKNSIFIMCTGNSQPGLVKNSIIHGVSSFITKPFSQAVIKEKVGKYFSIP